MGSCAGLRLGWATARRREERPERKEERAGTTAGLQWRAGSSGEMAARSGALAQVGRKGACGGGLKTEEGEGKIYFQNQF